MEKIKVGIVNYLNTRPLVYGIENSRVKDDIIFTGNYPSQLAKQLINGEIDLGLVPVAVIPALKNWHINTNYCIGTEGEVASVCIFSDVPLQEADRVLMDYQSRTSVALAKVLLKEYWKISPEIVSTENDYRPLIKGKTAGLVIGDRALEQRHHSKYIYDLGLAWKDLTGLPFVFAAWVSREELNPDFVSDFDAANKFGLTKIAQVVEEKHYEVYDLMKYYTENISYELTAPKLKGLDRFLGFIS
ncbi:MAG: menaquinone biosynthesis protein [Flavitalea sp.]